MASELPELLVPDAPAWRSWLADHHGVHDGVRLVLAKKGFTEPTRLVYAVALDDALCFGWIDGQRERRDECTYYQRFTRRRTHSRWSQKNVASTERLIGARLMQPAGLVEIQRAQVDGRWDAAYAGSSTIGVPGDLQVALDAAPAAAAIFSALTRQNRYAILYRLGTVKRPATRARKIEQYVAMLGRGESIYPQETLNPGSQ